MRASRPTLAAMLLTAALATGAALAPVAAQERASITQRVDGLDLVPSAERPAMLRAAGFVAEGPRIINRCHQPANFSDTNPPSIVIREIGGHMAALLRDTGSCYAPVGAYYSVIAKGGDGRWIQLLEGLGVVRMKQPGHGGWPDIEVQAKGACQPLFSWNGSSYVAAKTCKG